MNTQLLCFAKRFFSTALKKLDTPLRTSDQKFTSLTETGYYSNCPLTLDNSSNSIASKVLESGTICLADPEISAKSADVSTLKDLGQDTLKVELGLTNIYQNDQILLEDVDPKNIPKDKDIILWGKKARVFAIGRPAEQTECRNVHQKIFHEAKAGHGAGFTWKTYAKFCAMLPFMYYFAVYLEVLREFLYVESFYIALDRENMQLLQNLKETPTATIKTQHKLAKFYPTHEYIETK